jgi:hypothetical protein
MKLFRFFFLLLLPYALFALDTAYDSMTDDELNAEIADVKEQIEIYEGRSLFFDREADRIMTRDWPQYRMYISQKERCDILVQKFKQELDILEKEQAKRKNKTE